MCETAVSECDESVESSGGISDRELDAVIEEERQTGSDNKLYLSNPELASAQLKHMFPELSEGWRSSSISNFTLLKIIILKNKYI